MIDFHHPHPHLIRKKQWLLLIGLFVAAICFIMVYALSWPESISQLKPGSGSVDVNTNPAVLMESAKDQGIEKGYVELVLFRQNPEDELLCSQGLGTVLEAGNKYASIGEVVEGLMQADGSDYGDGWYNPLRESGVGLGALDIRDGRAEVQLQGQLKLSDGCEALHIATQIGNTLRQFESINSVNIRLNGEVFPPLR